MLKSQSVINRCPEMTSKEQKGNRGSQKVKNIIFLSFVNSNPCIQSLLQEVRQYGFKRKKNRLLAGDPSIPISLAPIPFASQEQEHDFLVKCFFPSQIQYNQHYFIPVSIHTDQWVLVFPSLTDLLSLHITWQPTEFLKSEQISQPVIINVFKMMAYHLVFI